LTARAWRPPLGVCLLHQIGQADRDQDAVDGPPRAVFLEQGEESQPGGTVHGLVAVLGSVAARGIEQHRLVGEPPVTVAGAADAMDGVLAETLRERKAQAGVDQGRGLAAAGGADDEVPGQLIDVSAAEPPFGVRLLQHRHGLAETPAQGLELLGGGHFRGVRLGLGSIRHLLYHPAVFPPGGDGLPDPDQGPDTEQTADKDPARSRLFQRIGARESEQGSQHPDQRRQGQYAQEGEEPGFAQRPE